MIGIEFNARRCGWSASLLMLAMTISTAAAEAGDTLRLLPERAEVIERGRIRNDLMIDARGRDCTALSFFKAIASLETITVDVDPGATDLLRRMIVTIDLRERSVTDVVQLLAASVGVDVESDVSGFRILAAPAPGSGAERKGLVRTAQRFYEIAVTRLGSVPDSAELSARSLRGMADIYRRDQDYLAAYSLYETLLAPAYRDSPSAKDCELLLADCYVEIGQVDRAGRLLRQFIDSGADRAATERALRRLISVLVEQERYRDVEDMRGAVAKLGALEDATTFRIAEAASAMVDSGEARAAATFLGEVWGAAPKANADLGPVLALALTIIGAADGASEILERSVGDLGTEIPASCYWAFAEMAAGQEKLPETLVYARRALNCDVVSPQIARRCHILLATLYENLALPERARRHLYEAELMSSPEDAVEMALRSAELTLAHGEPDHARLLFLAADEYQVGGHRAQMGVARALYAAREPKRALERVVDLMREELSADLSDEARVLASDCLADMNELERALAVLDGDTSALVEVDG